VIGRAVRAVDHDSSYAKVSEREKYSAELDVAARASSTAGLFRGSSEFLAADRQLELRLDVNLPRRELAALRGKKT